MGVGAVCEVKSGPAFYKTPGSQLVAVMRRDAALCRSFAERHQVPRWYTSAEALLDDPEVDAVYVGGLFCLVGRFHPHFTDLAIVFLPEVLIHSHTSHAARDAQGAGAALLRQGEAVPGGKTHGPVQSGVHGDD